MKIITNIIGLLLLVSPTAFAVDSPNGLVKTADGLAPNSYELMLTPQYVFDGGSYLTAELRHQPSESLGVGMSFGSGEIGYNFGAYGIWHILPDLETQPAFSILAGAYFNRVNPSNFFSLRFAPTLSETLFLSWGQITPYGAIQIAPTFEFGGSNNVLSLRATMGAQLTFDAMRGLGIWTELGLNLNDSVNQIVIGMSYPFAGFDA